MKKISQKDFLTLSEKELIKIADIIENKDQNSLFDIEYSDGILSIDIFSTGEKYVINKHSASQKIWFSSPVSGANYFAFNEKQCKWLDDKNQELETLLIDELEDNFTDKIRS